MKKTKKLSFSAIMSAAGVVAIYLGTLTGVLDLSSAVLASVFVIFAVIEFGGFYPWAIFGVTAVLSVIIVPDKFAAVSYALFLGYYPILKSFIEKLKSVPMWIVKFAVFNSSAVCVYLLVRFVTGGLLHEGIYILIYLAAANAVFLIYDIALTRLISLYYNTLRKRLRIGKMLK